MNDRRFNEPPPGFIVMRETDLYPDGGREGRWIGRGIIDGRSIIRAGMRSYSSAVRALWFAYDDACALGTRPAVVNIAEVDSAVAEALARKYQIHREIEAHGPDMKDTYTIALDSYDHMRTSLISQLLTDAGSIRRLSKIIDVPRSTLGAWVKRARDAGTWPL